MARDSKTTTETQTDNTAELQAQIAQLKDDLAAIASTLTDLGSRKLDNAKRQASDTYNQVFDQGQDTVEALKQRAVSLEEQVTDYVQERPLTSLAIAAAAGYILSVLTRR